MIYLEPEKRSSALLDSYSIRCILSGRDFSYELSLGHSAIMSAEKRPASDAFGSSQAVVKRQKSDAKLGDGRAIALVDGTASNGALIQAVSCTSPSLQGPTRLNRRLGKVG